MMIAAAHLTPDMSFVDVPSDAPDFSDGVLQRDAVRVARLSVDARRYGGYVQVTVIDSHGSDWYRRYLPSHLIDVLPN